MAFLPPSALVRALKRYASKELISPSIWPRIEALTARLPAIFEWAIFECRLAPDVDRVDMLFRVSRPPPGADVGERLARAFAVDNQDDHGFGPVLPFLRAWLANEDLARIPLFWIEHDLLPAGPSPPFVQFCVDPGFPDFSHESGSRKDGPSLAPEGVCALAASGLASLLGTSADADALHVLARCAARLPETGRVLHVGVMPHRGTRDLRVLSAVPVERTMDWLAAIGWQGQRARAAEILELLAPHFTVASVQLDIGDAVRPNLALEFPLPSRSGHHPAWRQFIDTLVERGWASREKGQAALDWMGDATHDLPNVPWLVNVQRQLDVKTVLSPHGDVEAKAYLAFHPRFVLA